MPEGFARIAAVSLPVHLGDVQANEKEIMAAMNTLTKQGVQVAVFPELCLTGYTLGDLLLHELVQKQAWEAMQRIAKATEDMAVIVGLPVNVRSRLFNCAAVLQGGKVRGVVPKTYLPNGNEFYETRWFVGGDQADDLLETDGGSCPLSPKLLFDMGGFAFAIEICEDLWTPVRALHRVLATGRDGRP